MRTTLHSLHYPTLHLVRNQKKEKEELNQGLNWVACSMDSAMSAAERRRGRDTAVSWALSLPRAAAAEAEERALEKQAELARVHPGDDLYIKSMLPSHISGCFWLVSALILSSLSLSLLARPSSPLLLLPSPHPPLSWLQPCSATQRCARGRLQVAELGGAACRRPGGALGSPPGGIRAGGGDGGAPEAA